MRGREYERDDNPGITFCNGVFGYWKAYHIQLSGAMVWSIGVTRQSLATKVVDLSSLVLFLPPHAVVIRLTCEVMSDAPASNPSLRRNGTAEMNGEIL